MVRGDRQVPDGWVSLRGGMQTTEAALAAGVLADRGITVTRRDDPASLTWLLGQQPQELLVPTQQLDDAREILKELADAPPVYPDDLSDS